jgi:Tol biopolymer transport system component
VQTRFTVDPGFDTYPLWSPDGLRIAFDSWRTGNGELFEKKAGGAREETVLMESPASEWPEAWSKDGRYIAYRKQIGSEYDTFVLPMFGDRKPFPIAQAPGNQTNADFSYDGKWMAYQSNESGRYQVYMISFPAADRKRQISSNGGVQPRWRRDGKELCYLAPDGKLMAVDITPGAEISPGIPRLLFDSKIKVNSEWGKQYAVAPDGQRFLLLKPLVEAAATPITVVLNWMRGLKQ